MTYKISAILLILVLVLTACSVGSTASVTQVPTIAQITPISLVTTSLPPSSPTPEVSVNEVKINISGFKFDPESITVKAGTTITWTNQDSANHTIVADDGSWFSADIAAGSTFSHTFDKAGTYPYHCGIHLSMKGTIIVQ